MAQVEVKVTLTATVIVETNDAIDQYDTDEMSEFLGKDFNDATPEEVAQAMVEYDAENDEQNLLDALDISFVRARAGRIIVATPEA